MNMNYQTRTIGKKVAIKRNASTKLRDVATLATSSIKQHTPNDVIYLKPIRFGCPYCLVAARPKVYSNLWKLRIHFRLSHGFTRSCQGLIETLENLIERKAIL
jgi:hypothetical protein